MAEQESVTYKLTNVTGICGHRVPEFWFDSNICNVRVKAFENGVRGVSHEVICPECYAKYRALDILLFMDADVESWLNGELHYSLCETCGNPLMEYEECGECHNMEVK